MSRLARMPRLESELPICWARCPARARRRDGTPGGKCRSGGRIAVADRILLDTGVLVALVNRSDPDHERCKAAWSPRRARIVTVEGVLVEAAHLLRRVRGGARAVVELVTAIPMELHAPTPAVLER